MDHALVTITVCFVGAVALFAGLTALLVYDDRRRVWTAPVPAADVFGPTPTRIPVGRVRLGVIAVTFFVWSLIVSDYLHPRH